MKVLLVMMLITCSPALAQQQQAIPRTPRPTYPEGGVSLQSKGHEYWIHLGEKLKEPRNPPAIVKDAAKQ